MWTKLPMQMSRSPSYAICAAGRGNSNYTSIKAETFNDIQGPMQDGSTPLAIQGDSGGRAGSSMTCKKNGDCQKSNLGGGVDNQDVVSGVKL